MFTTANLSKPVNPPHQRLTEYAFRRPLPPSICSSPPPPRRLLVFAFSLAIPDASPNRREHTGEKM